MAGLPSSPTAGTCRTSSAPGCSWKRSIRSWPSWHPRLDRRRDGPPDPRSLASGRLVFLGLVGRNPVRLQPGLLAKPAHPLLVLLPGSLLTGHALVTILVAVGCIERAESRRLASVQGHDVVDGPGLIGRHVHRSGLETEVGVAERFPSMRHAGNGGLDDGAGLEHGCRHEARLRSRDGRNALHAKTVDFGVLE